jgi:hypothetical protein
VPRKRPEDDISEQRPEFGDYRAPEMAAKTAFLLASCQLRVSEDRTWDPLIKRQADLGYWIEQARASAPQPETRAS